MKLSISKIRDAIESTTGRADFYWVQACMTDGLDAATISPEFSEGNTAAALYAVAMSDLVHLKRRYRELVELDKLTRHHMEPICQN